LFFIWHVARNGARGLGEYLGKPEISAKIFVVIKSTFASTAGKMEKSGNLAYW
jgi:hypothetical protein